MDLISILRGAGGLAFVVGLAYLFSPHKSKINWKLVGTGILLQILFALFVIKTSIGRDFFGAISRLFVTLFGFASEGAKFVFGGLGIPAGNSGSLGFFFAFQVLPTIIFFASFMAILYHLGIMQRVVQGIAWVMVRLLRTSGAESLSVAASVFVGQTEAPLVIRPYLSSLTQSELMTIMTSGMAHVSGGVMAAYVALLGAAYARTRGVVVDGALVQFMGHFLAASVMAAPATMVISKMLIPELGDPVTMGSVKVKIEKLYSDTIEAAAAGASDGVKLAINVAGMLLAFIALIALIDYLLGGLGWMTGINPGLIKTFGYPLSLELLFGMVFQFIAVIIGVPWHDALNVGSLMGIKLVLNEFVAYSKMADMIGSGLLSEKSIVIATYALCGFANFSSIAIQIGGLGTLAESRRSDIARLGMRAVLAGTIATWMTAAIAGILVS